MKIAYPKLADTEIARRTQRLASARMKRLAVKELAKVHNPNRSLDWRDVERVHWRTGFYHLWRGEQRAAVIAFALAQEAHIQHLDTL